ncbi:unnamed protein product [Closterium sp. NIES-65]|nr:unnamed protein product [Closterium sp. NIES-65]
MVGSTYSSESGTRPVTPLNLRSQMDAGYHSGGITIVEKHVMRELPNAQNSQLEAAASQLESPDCSSVSAQVLSRPAAGSSLTSFPISELYHVEHYLKAVQRQSVAARRSLLGRRQHATPGAHDGSDRAIFEDMLSFQRDPIPTSLTRLPTDLQTKAVRMFQDILHYMGLNGAPITDERELAQTLVRILKMVLRKPEMREELYAQLHKQTRNNHDREACLRAWEVMHLCASVAPPGAYLGTPITEYVHEIANDAGVDEEVKSQALATWHALKKAMKIGARKTIPTVDELLALMTGRALKTMVFFLDDTFEEVGYDASTTAAEILERVATSIRLEEFQTFGLYEHRKYITLANNNSENVSNDYMGIDEKAYIGDVMAELMSFREKSERQVQLRLLFRKKFFRENEEAITDQVFVQLSYLQAKQDYEEGNYPVPRDDVAQLAALQLIVDFGLLPEPEVTLDWQAQVERTIPVQFQPMRQKREWDMDVLTRYKALSHLTPEDARQQTLRIIRALPYGGSAFYHVRRIEDPIGLLPGRVLIGINKRGVHFFRPVPKEYLHSAELRDIMQFGSSPAAVFFKMRVVGSLHVFQFETTQGEEICLAIQTHINDALTRRFARQRARQHNAPMLGLGPAGGGGAAGEGISAGGGGGGGVLGEGQGQGPHPITEYEHRTKELSESLTRAFMHIEQLNQEVAARAAAEAKLQSELQAVREALRQGEVANEEVVEERDRLAEMLQMANQPGREAALSSGSITPGNVRRRDGLGSTGSNMSLLNDARTRALESQLKEVQEELKAVSRRAEEQAQAAAREKQALEKQLANLELTKDNEIKALDLRSSAERDELAARLAIAEQRLEESRAAEAQLREEVKEKEAQSEHLEEFFKELDELREMKEEMERNRVENLEVIQRQGKQIAELEKAYKEEIVLRKRYYNMMEGEWGGAWDGSERWGLEFKKCMRGRAYKEEILLRKRYYNMMGGELVRVVCGCAGAHMMEDMKGKIRVYARWRPLSGRERGEGQRMVLEMPDEFTLQHPWKDPLRPGQPKAYQFDRVFDHTATQEAVFEDTRYLIQSAIDGYNVCIFAYGQTGSGKTFTIYGGDNNPGLTPRAMQELFNCLRKEAGRMSYKLQEGDEGGHNLGLTPRAVQVLFNCVRKEAGRMSYKLQVGCPSGVRVSRGREQEGGEWGHNSGLTPRAMQELFNCLRKEAGRMSFKLEVYMLELYQDTLQDLLLPKSATKRKLEIKKDAKGMVVVENATLIEVQYLSQLEAVVQGGMERRAVAGTQMNAESSRSHLVLSIVIETTDLQTQNVCRGKLSFVDLAGSERVKKSRSEGEQLREAQSINKSLSALGDVISALAQGGGHIPYRNHKLTMLMSDSLGGNAKTLIYATRVRSIVNEASKNVANKEVQWLKSRISHWKQLAGARAEEEELDEVWGGKQLAGARGEEELDEVGKKRMPVSGKEGGRVRSIRGMVVVVRVRVGKAGARGGKQLAWARVEEEELEMCELMMMLVEWALKSVRGYA